MKTYQETIDFLFAQLPMYQRVGKAAYKADLETTLALDAYFKQPHQHFKTIHVGGTNGKGSVSHCLASILAECGLKVGLYTSPHLKDFRERIKINGVEITEEAVVQFVHDHSAILKKLQPSFFEMTVALAFDYFEKMKVDIAVIEVGMGGRLDSTNIISPLLSVITNIGLDHTAFLGTTIEAIAREKGGIIKANTPVVIGETHPESKHVFETIAAGKNAPIQFADQCYNIPRATKSFDQKQLFQVSDTHQQVVLPDLKLDLLGFYQQKNLATVLSSIEILRELGIDITTDSLYQGLQNVVRNTGFLGRWQQLSHNPLVICDTGHNIDGIRYIIDQLENTPYKHLHMILGMVNDKDHEAVLSLLPKTATYYFTKASIPRSLYEKELQQMAAKHDLNGESYPNVEKALAVARKNADDNDLIFIGGSTFIVADAL